MLASIFFATLSFIFMLFCGRLTAEHAAKRGRSRGIWFVLGLFFFPLTSLVLALLPPRTDDKAIVPG